MNKTRFTTIRYNTMLDQMKNKKIKDPIVIKYNFELKNGKLFSGGKEIIPHDKRDETLRDLVLNKAAPLSLDQLFLYAQKLYWGLSKRYVHNWLRSTEEYQLMKRKPFRHYRLNNKVQLEGKTSENLRKHKNMLGIDLVQPHAEWTSNKYIAVCVHYATSYTWAATMRTKTAQKTLDTFRPMLADCIKRFGKVDRLTADAGSEFKGVFAAYLSERGIKKEILQMCSWVEKKNSSLCRSIGSLLGMGHGWRKAFKLAIEKVNNTKSRITGKAPIEWTLQDLNQGAPKRKNRKLKFAPTAREQPIFKKNNLVRHLTHRAQGKTAFWKSYESTSVEKRENWSKIYKITKIQRPGKYDLIHKYFVNGKWFFAYQLQLVPENTISIKKRKPVDAVFVNLVDPQFVPLRPQGRIDVGPVRRSARIQKKNRPIVTFVDLSLDDD